MTASDVASVNEFPDVCAVIQLMDPSASRASDDNTTYQVSLYLGPTYKSKSLPILKIFY